MAGGRVADVLGEAVLRDSRGRDCASSASRIVLATIEAAAIDIERRVAVDDRARRADEPVRRVAAVDQREMRTQAQARDRPRHCAQRRAADVEGVDLLDAGEDDRDAERLGEDDLA